MDPFGTRTRNGLCTGHDVRGPQRETLFESPCNGTELKLLLLQGLHMGGGGIGIPLYVNGPGGGPITLAGIEHDIGPPPPGGPGPGP